MVVFWIVNDRGLVVQSCSSEPAGERTSPSITAPDSVTTPGTGEMVVSQVTYIVTVFPLERKGFVEGLVMAGVNGIVASRVHWKFRFAE